MNSAELKEFRKMMQFSQAQMADKLGYARRQYQLMEQGKADIRPCVGLACAAMALGIQEYNGPIKDEPDNKESRQKLRLW
jgi:transcriptional regulator with XRE-family HTH domain